ncbi:CHAT domain-containing protein [Penaeicola halotolerans]|uniref:CHAT domain-containing protein n=1 Tax=Penaeicola halotolerans TaxID=2793196 RepID=UPI001CF88AD9|nr:CHAT domain-containing tetratricopeptide repeat protein [Penaeicola halotolerans]
MFYRLFAYTIIYCLLSTSALAQRISYQDSLKVIELTQKGDAFLQSNELDSAILTLEKANTLINAIKDGPVEIVHGVKNRLGISYAYRGLNKRSIATFNELADFYRARNEEHKFDIQIAQLYSNIAINYNLLFDYAQSLRYFDSSLVIFQKRDLQLSDQSRLLYINKASNHLDLSNYQSAIENLEIAKLIRLSNPESDPTGYEKMKENLVLADALIEINQNKEEILEARNYLKENLRILEAINPNDQYVGSTYYNLQKTYRLLSEYDSAIYYGQKAVNFLQDQYGPTYPGLISRMASLGKLYALKGEGSTALDVLDKAIAIPTPQEIDKLPYKAQAHLSKAQVYLQNKSLDKVEKSIASATKLIFPTFENSDNIWMNPSVDSLFQSPIFSNYFIEKGALLKGLYDQTEDINYLKGALDAYILGIKIGMRTRKGLTSLRSKSLYSSYLANNFDQAIELAFLLQDQTKKLEDFWTMLWLSDLSKAATLKDFVQGKENITLGIPKHIASKEIDLKSNLLYYEQAVYKESFAKTVRSSEPNSENRLGLIKAKSALDEFIREVKRDYPNYYQLEYGSEGLFADAKTTDFTALRAGFKSQLVIDIHENSEAYLISFFDQKIQGAYKVPKSEQLEKSINELLRIISTKASGDYQKYAYTIYDKLLSPSLASSNPDKIVIIPAGKLAYLPFELLISEEADSKGFKDFKYLIKDYTISYQYAISLLKPGQKTKKSTKNEMLALSPDFDIIRSNYLSSSQDLVRGSIDKLSVLPFAKKELEKLSEVYKGDFLIGQNASEASFKSKAPTANMIHLATHSFINESNPLNSQLILGSDTNEDGLLHTYEIFGLSLQADLVTLSACNSGFGELQRGEGVISLARGFMYAGAANVLMSLWAVPDRSTSILMESFYTNINEGLSYDEAIRAAKLSYLASSDDNTAHPYYWGAFVFVGEDTMEQGPNYWPFLIIGALILIGITIWIAKATKPKNQSSKPINYFT